MKSCRRKHFASVSDVQTVPETAQMTLSPSKNFALKPRLRLLFLLLTALTWAMKVSAQTSPDLEQGMKPYGSYHGGALDQVSLTNGNLVFRADLFSYSQRGSELAYPIILQYNNKVFSDFEVPCGPVAPGCIDQHTTLFGPNPLRTFNISSGNSVTVGYEGLPQVALGFVDTSVAFDDNEIYLHPPSVLMPDGSTHQLVTTNSGLVTVDGSGYAAPSTVPTSGALTSRDGTLHDPLATWAEDRNGNQLTSSSSGWKDSLGRQIPAMPGTVPTGTAPASTANLTACPALNYSNQAVTYAYIWNLPTVNGGTLPLILCYAGVWVRTGSSNGPHYFDVSQSFIMLQSVVFPDNTYWAFQYDAADPNNPSSIAYGDLLKVTFPTGGTITYTWQMWPPCVSQNTGTGISFSRAVQKRTLDAGDGAGPHTWQYSYGSGYRPNGQTVVTDPANNDTVHVITGLSGTCSLYETQTQYYQGSHTSGGTLLKTVTTDYQYTVNPYDPLAITQNGTNSFADSVTNVFPIRVTTTLPNGLVSKVETDYDNAVAYHGPVDGITWNVDECPSTGGGGAGHTITYPPVTSPPPSGGGCWGAQQTNAVTNYTGSYGKVIATRTYDWGQGAPGALLLQTQTQYQWQTNTAYLTANMLDLPAVVKTLDGSGNLCAETDYSYDEPGYLKTPNPAITTQHVAAPAAVRGNLTTVTHKLTTTPCAPNATQTTVSSHTNWFDTGEVYQSIDPLNNKTTHAYDPTYAGAYPTQTTNALNQSVNGTYDFNSGLLTSFTDANNQTSNYSYDNRWRMTSAVFPPDSSGNRPETDFNYPNLTTIQRMKKQQGATSCTVDASHCIVDYAYFDGVGRTKQTRLVDPAGDDYVDTTYDAMGRVSTVSNPHRSTSSMTDGITASSYDALGRVTQVTAQDGSVSTTDYSNFPTVTVTDPAGKMRRSRTDSLGRLVEVDEPGPGANTGGSPGTGSINVSGSLYSSTSSGNKATGSVTVSGAVQTMFTSVCDPDSGLCIRQSQTDPGGTVTITVNGHQNQVNYGGGSTANSIADDLIANINGDTGAFVTASGPSCADSTDCTISLQARTPGPSYSLSAQGLSNDEADGFTSFDATYASGSSLTGGVYPVTSYDSGTVTVTISGSQITTFHASASYNQNLNTTAAAITTALISSLSGSGSPVKATLSGTTTILLKANSVGTASDLTVTGSSTASFTASSTGLSNGTNPGGLYTPYVTTYSYDPLGNLLQVNQPGDGSQAARVRTFTYDSLSRLLTANNPESGTISYTYDANSNVTTKTDARGVVINYSPSTSPIDALNRVTAVTYSDGTPPVAYGYDVGCCGVNPQNGVGRLTYTMTGNTELVYVYDPMGRIKEQADCPPSGIARGYCYGLYASYDLTGGLTSLSYPDGQTTITFTSNTAGRMLSAVDATRGVNYATSGSYAPDGSLTGFISGSVLTNTFIYNSRLQPCRMTASSTGVIPANCSSSSGNVLDLAYDFHFGNGNNGNVYGITNYRDQSRNQTFTYDQLNRLVSAQNLGTDCSQSTANGKTKFWGNIYGYDAWGNLLTKSATKCVPENLNVTADAQNRLHVSAGADYQYDAAGNMTYNAAGMYYSYDAESRILHMDTSAATYTYNSLGERVRKDVNGGPSAEYFYFAGQPVAELNPATGAFTNYVFFDGTRVARRDGPTGPVSYYFSDHLKTTDIVTDAQGNIKSESDFYPYGGELQFVNGDSNHYKFTGKERDNETGLDYFGARYYSNGLGRFITPDWAAKAAGVPYAVLGDPQSLNLYTYVRNIPTTNIDTDGHETLNANNNDKGNTRMVPCDTQACREFDGQMSGLLLNGFATVTGPLGRAFFAAEAINDLSSGNKTAGVLGLAAVLPLGKVAGSVWNLGNFARGVAIETALGKNLANGFPVIDKFIKGIATSIKSIDLTAKSYQDTEKLASTLGKYVDKVSNFNGAEYGKDVVEGSKITARELQVAIPKGSMSAAQQEVFDAAAARAANLKQPVKLTVTEIQ